ncbi:hypothetical protein [Luteolibacter sp. LG18]|uniref:hypothetical protein n=1 Tax=Luteolibacter sp. LG18 TaxID=2819286 RepID=UPI002B2C177C|nr:hypothetical protein llg_22810 [Luteolibacter sp. LG18]BCU79600.1 hypothetical protein llg_43150 [Luteolibacter sp. LG18]
MFITLTASHFPPGDDESPPWLIATIETDVDSPEDLRGEIRHLLELLGAAVEEALLTSTHPQPDDPCACGHGQHPFGGLSFAPGTPEREDLMARLLHELLAPVRRAGGYDPLPGDVFHFGEGGGR